MPSLVEIGLMVLEKKIFLIPSMYFRYFFIISPSERAGSFIWTNLNPFTQGCIVPSLVEIGSVVLEKEDFFNFVNLFSLFVIISPWEKGRALNLNNLESPSPTINLIKVRSLDPLP